MIKKYAEIKVLNDLVDLGYLHNDFSEYCMRPQSFVNKVVGPDPLVEFNFIIFYYWNYSFFHSIFQNRKLEVFRESWSLKTCF